MSEVGGGGGRRRLLDEDFTLQVYPGSISPDVIYCPVPARWHTTAADVIDALIAALRLDRSKFYVLAEVKEFGGEEWILNPTDYPVQRMMLWPRLALEARGSGEDYRFLLREKNMDGSIHYGSLHSWLKVTEERRHMVERGFFPQQQGPECEDLCVLPDLSERALLETLRTRFRQEKIYTYVGSILVAVNPFRFLPIYNPKYVKMYDNRRLGEREPHIYAVADAAYHAMLRRQRNQCIVISGETGSGKTQSTNFLIHHLTALSQKGYASGVEQIILGAGPVLEAFGNAKTSQNNNSSRFGKFIQVNYHETGTVRGAYVEKYLLEKSRLVYQEQQERNYHVFYYLLAGASEEEKAEFHLERPESYHYLSQKIHKPHRQGWGENDGEDETDSSVEGEDLRHDFERLQLAMEMVGFLPATRKQIVSLLSAILHLGNIQYKRKTYRDESIDISNPETLSIVSELLKVREEMLLDALITRKTVTVGEKLILPYRLPEAVTVRDSLAKSLYTALFDWIVFRINHALLNINSKAMEDSSQTLSIGVLDIFGFEDYGSNSFEQFCINFANERLQHYFNQHLFQLEQELYRSEGISWNNINYSDNEKCINLISKRPTGLIQLLDEECNFPQATHQTLLEKFKRHHEGNAYIEFPAVMEPAFIIQHYAGKVKYGVKDFREKNTDHMRPDIVSLLRSSRNAFIRGMIAISPVAAFRWALLRAFFRALWAFKQNGKNNGGKKTGTGSPCTPGTPGSAHKGLSSFSFLQHPVHQRSLQILQRCQNDQYNIPRRTPRSPLSDLQGVNTIQERSPRELSWAARRQSRLSSSSSYLEGGGIFISSPGSNMNSSSDSKLLERAHGILMRNKNPKTKPTLPKHLLDVRSLKHLSNLTLHDRITKSLLHLHKKKKPPSISAQFQASLNKLMETLGQAEPYFVKCIRSNAEKVPLRFNDTLVLRQLRYTGMLETVRIRQSGYSCKYPFQDFVTQFSVLLPKDVIPVRQSIQEFFWRVGHSPDQYQVGKTTVFLKEQERQCLREKLHQTVLQRIILLQRWMRAMLQRKRFLQLKEAAITIQRCWRHYKRRWSEEQHVDTIYQAAVIIQSWWRCQLARHGYLKMKTSAVTIQRCWQKYLLRRRAAICIQSAWRGYAQWRLYRCQRRRVIALQAASRGYLARRRFPLRNQIKPHGFLGSRGAGDTGPPSVTQNVENQKGEDTSYREIFDQGPADSTNSEEIQGVGEIASEVHIRERPKSLENPNQRKVVRAKRESRRMRELEQAQFSLDLLKVRSGGMSPSEERRWSAELVDKFPGTPESEGSLGSLELISCDENQHFTEDRPAEMGSTDAPLSSPTERLSSAADEVLQGSSSSDLADSFTHGTNSIPSKGSTSSKPKGPSMSPIYDPESTPSGDSKLHSFAEPLSTPTSRPISSPSHSTVTPTINDSSHSSKSVLGSHMSGQSNVLDTVSHETNGSPKTMNVPSNGPMSYPTKVASSGSTDLESASNHRPSPAEVSSQLQQKSSHHPPSPVSSAVDISWGASSSRRQKSTGLEMSESAPTKSSVPVFYRSHLREPILSSSLPTFYVPNQESLKAPEHTEQGEIPTDAILHLLQKLNEEKEEQQKQVQQQKEQQMMEQIRKEKLELERQRKMQEQSGGPTGASQPHQDIMRPSKKTSDRPQSLFLQSPQHKCPPPKPTLEIKGLTVRGHAGQTSHNDRPVSMFLEQKGGRDTKLDGVAEMNDALRRPWLHNHANPGMFFNPKGNVSSDSENSAIHPNRGVRADPTKRLDATEPSGVSEAPHRRKARMARTRSDFMTRGAVGGQNSEEDSDEQGDRILPTDPAEETGTLSQACHSDSEMMLQKMQGGERQSKLQKAMSQGEMSRVLLPHRTTEPDTRPQRGKIRFWGKMKAAEKLTTQSEVLEMDSQSSGKEGNSIMHYNDVDTGLWLVPHSPDLSRGREKENKDPSPKIQRRRSLKISSAVLELAQWQDERAQIICSANDLKCMDEFLLKKICDLDSEDGKKDSMVDVLFKRALKEFRQNIFNLYSTSLVGEDGRSIRYKDLGSLFEQILDKTMRQHQSRSWPESPVQVWINTFKVFLDEFVTEYKPLNYTAGKIQKLDRKKRRKKESDILEEHNGHIFKATQYNIPTYCEFCSSLIWIMDRAAVCKLCRFACHKKCCSQINTPCSKKYDHELSNRHFGVELSRLTNEERTVPVLLEKLISYIEMHGLYTEGIYRKPGSTNKIRELRQSLDTDIDNVNLDDYNIHVIASVFKQWLRELPNPLMTFELYDEFLKSMGLGDRKETVLGVYSVIDQLSRTHLCTLERLIFHLVRIAQQEETNRMSANALAIVFAPCILRCPDTTDPLQSVQDIGKTTACVELIVVEQMNKYKARLKDISSLEFAENRAKSRLSLIRRSMGKGRLRSSLSPVISGLSAMVPDTPTAAVLSNIPSEDESTEQKEAAMQQEERVLAQQIETLQKEKEELAYEMLALEPRASDDETLESEASLGTADSSENLNYESEGAVPTRAERSIVLSSARGTRSEPARTKKTVKREGDRTDGADRNLSSPVASSCLPHLGRKRFHLHTKSPFYRALGDGREPSSTDYHDPGAPVHFTSRGTFNPEKGRQKLKNVKQSPQKPREPLDSTDQRILGSDGSSQSLVLFGNNEFMV